MIFFLFGEDNYRSKAKLLELKKMFSEKNPFSEIKTFDFSEKNHEIVDIFENISSEGLFSSKKMAVIENILAFGQMESQKKILEKMQELQSIESNQEKILVFKENNLPKKNLSLYKFLISKSKSQQFDFLSQKDLEKWILNWIKNNFPEIILSEKILAMLTSYIGNDLFLLEKELEKIGNFKLTGDISEEDVNLLVKSHVHSNIFQAIEALLGNNKKLALNLFHEQLEKGEDPFYILSMYAYQIRSFLKISSLLDRGIFDIQAISKETKVHPYVIQKSISQVRLAGTEKLREVFKKISDIDAQSKIGKTDLKTALDSFIVSI